MHVPDKEKNHGEMITQKGAKVSMLLRVTISGNSKERYEAKFIFKKSLLCV